MVGPAHLQTGNVLSLVDEVSGRVCGVEVFDEALHLIGVLGLRHVHRVVGTDHLLGFLRPLHPLALRVLLDHWVALPACVEDGQLVARWRHVVDVVVQILLHHSRVRALSQLSSLLNPALPEDALAHLELVRVLLVCLRFSWHDELFEGRLGKLLLDLLLEVDQLQFYLWIDVPFPLQWSAGQRNHVTLRSSLLPTHVLLTVGDSLTHTIQVVTLG